MKLMNTSQMVNLLLSRENEITNKFHNTITEILRFGYDSEKGKTLIPALIESVQYSLEEIERVVNR